MLVLGLTQEKLSKKVFFVLSCTASSIIPTDVLYAILGWRLWHTWMASMAAMGGVYHYHPAPVRHW
jgi:hypothetical protein